MATTNEKLVILEDNLSQPMGAGASSDIAYIPGVTFLKDEADKPVNINVPILCNTVDDFKTYFGDTPAIATTVAYNYGSHTIKANSEDISYWYAYELLNAGISVYYEPIVADTAELSANKTELTAEKDQLDLKIKELKKILTTGTVDVNPNAAKEKEALEKRKAEIDVELSLITAEEALSPVEYFYKHLGDALDEITDMGEYSIKYITTGGYPVFTAYSEELNNPLAVKLIGTAKKRGDAVAIIDHGDNGDLPLGANSTKSIYNAVSRTNWGEDICTFGTIFTPWATYSCPGAEKKISFPASFAYLLCLAKAIKTSPNYLAMAGITRGQVPYIQKLDVKKPLTNFIAEDYQPRYGDATHRVSMNAITEIKPYGLTLWGNRTLEEISDKGTTAMAMLNTRNMVSDIKKVAYSTAKKLMFEQDGIVLWNRFTAGISPLLEQLKLGRGISNYAIIRNKTKYNGRPLDRGELSATIKIYPVAAIEYFEITVAIADEEVSMS